jgi:hypothetical protein
MWNPRHDETDYFLTSTARISSSDEYRHMLCYSIFTSTTNAALETAIVTTRSVTSTPDDKAYAYAYTDATTRTHKALPAAGGARLAYDIRFKAN